jgi:hypothetical protein
MLSDFLTVRPITGRNTAMTDPRYYQLPPIAAALAEVARTPMEPDLAELLLNSFGFSTADELEAPKAADAQATKPKPCVTVRRADILEVETRGGYAAGDFRTHL